MRESPLDQKFDSEAIYVGEVELAGSLYASEKELELRKAEFQHARLLVRLATEPLGFVDVTLPLERGSLAEVISRHFFGAIRARLDAAGSTKALGADGLNFSPTELAGFSWLIDRQSVLAEAPNVSVVICTRDRSDLLARALSSVTRQEYPEYEIVVIDNAPSDGSTAEVVASWASDDAKVQYEVEPRPGLAWARNAGLAVSRGEIVAYIDDDELPDVHWLAELARGFASHESVAAVGGLILPLELATPAQRLFEAFGGHSKGRGLEQEIFDVASHRRQHPLYPLPPFAAGGNMAFRRHVLQEIGGFDVALGTGTPGRGGEDSAALADIMLARHTVVWQPSAFVYHSHYGSADDASNQLFGYGVGLTAFYTRAILERPRSILDLARLAPRAIKDVFANGSLRNGGPDLSRLPPELRGARRRGMMAGPGAYLRSRRLQRKLSTRA